MRRGKMYIDNSNSKPNLNMGEYQLFTNLTKRIMSKKDKSSVLSLFVFAMS